MKLMTFFLIMISFILVSCKEKKQDQVTAWDGANIVLRCKEYPKSIIWFKESAKGLWIPYKGFCQANEIKEIVRLAEQPEITDANPALITRDKLTLIYYEGTPKEMLQVREKYNLSSTIGEPLVLTAVEIYFDIKDGIFIGTKGKSKELGKLLLSKEESGLGRYRFATPPYDENAIDAMEKMEQNVREKTKKLSEHKQDDVNK